MKYVLDASVAIRWGIPHAITAKAIALREDYRNKLIWSGGARQRSLTIHMPSCGRMHMKSREDEKMPIAVLKNGEIRPLEPLPADWQDGQRLRIESADENDATPDEIDRDFALLAQLCADSDPEDEQRLTQLLDEVRQQSKEQMRRQLGLD